MAFKPNLTDLDQLKEEDTIIPLHGKKKFMIKEIHECPLLPKVDFDQSISILDNRISQFINEGDKMTLHILHGLITPHIRRDEKLNGVSQKIIIIKLKYNDDNGLEFNSYLIFDFAGYIYYMGSFLGIKRLQEFMHDEIIKICKHAYRSTLNFSSRFLLWLVLKIRRGDSELMNEVVINQITEASVNQMKNGGLNYGKIIKVSLSKNITKSLPILTSLMRGHVIDSCTFEINFRGYNPAIQIKSNTKIGFSSSGFFRKFEHIERFVIGIHIVHLLIEVYNNWVNCKDIKNKEIQESDIDKIVNDCQRYVEVMFNKRMIEKIFGINGE